MTPFASPEYELKASQPPGYVGPSPPPSGGKKRKFARLPSLQLTHFVPLPEGVMEQSDQPTPRLYDENVTMTSSTSANSLGLHNLHTRTFDLEDEADTCATFNAASSFNYGLDHHHQQKRSFGPLACLDPNLPLHDASPASSPAMSRQSSYSSFNSTSTFGSLSTARSISSMRSTATTLPLCDSFQDSTSTTPHDTASPYYFSKWSFSASKTSTSLTPELSNFALPRSPRNKTFVNASSSPLSAKSPLTTTSRFPMLFSGDDLDSLADNESDDAQEEQVKTSTTLLFAEPSFKRTRSDTVSTAASVSSTTSVSTTASSVEPESDMSPCTAPLALPHTSSSGHSYSVKDREPLHALHRQLKHWIKHALEPLTTARLSKIGVKASPGTSLAVLRRAAAPGSIIVTRANHQGLLETWYDGLHRDDVASTSNAPKLTIHRFMLPKHLDETLAQGKTSDLVPIACIKWNGECYVTVCDVIRILTFRLHVLGYKISNTTKLSEGVYSDLRTCRPDVDYHQLDAGSPVLLAAASLGATQSTKAQRIFRWFSFDHDRLLINALQRDVDRALRHEERVVYPRSEPATLFRPERGGLSLAQRFGFKGEAPVISNGRSASAAMLQALALGWHANYARGQVAPQHASLKLASSTSNDAPYQPDSNTGYVKQEEPGERNSSPKLRSTRVAAVAAAKALRR